MHKLTNFYFKIWIFHEYSKSAKPQQVQSRCELRFPKKPLFSPFLILLPLEALDLGGAPLRYSEVQGPFLSAKLLFVRIAAANVKLPGYFQRVLSTIFKVMQIIELVDTYVKTSQKASSER